MFEYANWFETTTSWNDSPPLTLVPIGTCLVWLLLMVPLFLALCNRIFIFIVVNTAWRSSWLLLLKSVGDKIWFLLFHICRLSQCTDYHRRGTLPYRSNYNQSNRADTTYYYGDTPSQLAGHSIESIRFSTLSVAYMCV